MAAPGRVLVATTNKRAQDAVQAVLRDVRPIVVVDRGASARAQLDLCAVWSLIIVDSALPDEPADALLPWLRERVPSTTVALLTVVPDKRLLCQAIRLNTALLPLPLDHDALRSLIQRVFATEASSNEQLRRVLDSFFRRAHLSPRESQLVMHAISGLDRDEICRRYGIKHSTLANQITELLARFGARNMNELALGFFRSALLMDPTPVAEHKQGSETQPPSARPARIARPRR